MGAKIILTGSPEKVQINNKKNTVSFVIVTGPSVKSPPKGLQLYGETEYQVNCSMRQWKRGRFSDDDDSDLIIEGFQEARQAGQKSYIAVVAMSMQSMRIQKERKLQQLTEQFDQATMDFVTARKDPNISQKELERVAGALVKARDSVTRFRERNPELTGPKP